MRLTFIFAALTFVFAFFFIQPVLAQKTTVKGTIIDEKSKKPVPYAAVYIKDVHVGVTTDDKGRFLLSTAVAKPPFELIVSATNYADKELIISKSGLDLKIYIVNRPNIIRDVVVSAPSRQPEKALQSPITVEQMGLNMINASPGPDVYGNISNLKSVYLNRNSMVYQSLSSRGLSTFINARFVQMVDGVDQAPPGLSFTLGNMVSISELDIEKIELIPGTASALYGPNAFSGLLSIQSKDPFKYRGVAARLKTGVTSQSARGSQPFGELAVRLAGTFGAEDRLGVKLNFSGFQGNDWLASDSTDIDQNPINESLRGLNSPSFNGANIYGDEIAITIDVDRVLEDMTGLSLNLLPIRVARTGYKESDLRDQSVKSYKFGAGVYYKIKNDIILKADYRFGLGQAPHQGANRIMFKNLSLQQFVLGLENANFTIKGAFTQENAGDSYDMGFGAWNINRAWKSDQQWFTEYTRSYLQKLLGIGVTAATTPTEAHDFARGIADQGRLIPGTERFLQTRDSIFTVEGLDNGAKFIDRSSLLHLEGTYNFKAHFKPIEIQVGANLRRFKLNSEGTLFNDADQPIVVSEYGAFLMLGKFLFPNKRLKFNASIRYDKNQNFAGQFSPRGSIVFSLDKKRSHNIRASLQTGFRYPDAPGQFLALNFGANRSIGGAENNILNYSFETTVIDTDGNEVETTVEGIDIYNNSYEAVSVVTFLNGYSQSLETGLTAEQALVENVHLLEPSEIEFLKPEQINSWEIGYKGLVFEKLLIDLHYFRSRYSDLLFFSRLVHAVKGDVTDLTEYSGGYDVIEGRTVNLQVVANAAEVIKTQGLGIGFEYAFKHSFLLGAHYSFLDQLGDVDFNTENLPALNAPKHKIGFFFGSHGIGKSNFGFMTNIKWTDRYIWKDRLATAVVDPILDLDMQVNYHIPQINTTFKLGGTNLFHGEYRQVLGTAVQGSIFYISLTYEGFNKPK
ncbi:MAG: carboxypeptidase-like regulatory domain-containing protein [Bacteroidota bacterium]